MMLYWYNLRITALKKQSPDVDTPGLLVKALISSYVKYVLAC